jgi:hypothetical protein
MFEKLPHNDAETALMKKIEQDLLNIPTLTMQETLLLEKYDHNKHCFINVSDGAESGVSFTLQELVQLTKLVNE